MSPKFHGTKKTSQQGKHWRSPPLHHQVQKPSRYKPHPQSLDPVVHYLQGRPSLCNRKAKKVTSKVLYFVRCISWRFFTWTSSELCPLNSAGCLPATHQKQGGDACCDLRR